MPVVVLLYLTLRARLSMPCCLQEPYMTDRTSSILSGGDLILQASRQLCRRYSRKKSLEAVPDLPPRTACGAVHSSHAAAAPAPPPRYSLFHSRHCHPRASRQDLNRIAPFMVSGNLQTINKYKPHDRLTQTASCAVSVPFPVLQPPWPPA